MRVPGARQYDYQDHLWFKFEVEELLKREVVQNWPSIRKRPIRKEYVYIQRNFLLQINWIEKRFTAEAGEEYFSKNDVVPLVPFKNMDLRQVLYFNPETYVDKDGNTMSYGKEILMNPKNKNGSFIMEATQFFYPISLGSWFYNDNDTENFFRSYMFRWKGGGELLVNGTFLEFSKLNYNELPSNLSSVLIWVGRGIMDWHWQPKNERHIFNYISLKRDFNDSLVRKLSSKIPWYLDCNSYIEHIGRFKRFPENAWLMFLNVKNANGQFYRPYRVINSEAYLQEEADFYAVPKAKIGEFFNLAKDDDAYLAIFKKVEDESRDAEEVWISDVLLGMR